MGWAKGMLCILERLNYNDFSTKGICNTTYKVSHNIKDCSFINLYMYFPLSIWEELNVGVTLVVFYFSE